MKWSTYYVVNFLISRITTPGGPISISVASVQDGPLRVSHVIINKALDEVTSLETPSHNETLMYHIRCGNYADFIRGTVNGGIKLCKNQCYRYLATKRNPFTFVSFYSLV